MRMPTPIPTPALVDTGRPQTKKKGSNELKRQFRRFGPRIFFSSIFTDYFFYIRFDDDEQPSQWPQWPPPNHKWAAMPMKRPK